MASVAVIISGNPRSFKRCYPSFKENIIDTLNPDIFIHTWRLEGRERPDVTVDGSCEEYIDLYKPTAFEIEDLTYDHQPLHTMVPHFTSRYKANQLRKNHGKKYDVVISHRADVRLIHTSVAKGNSVTLGSKFKPEYANMVTEDSIWIHHFKGPAQPSTRNAIPADYLFYSSEKWMDITTDCYFEMDKLDYYKPGSERLWWYKLEKEGFNYDWFRFYGNSIHDQEHIDKSLKLFDIECVR